MRYSLRIIFVLIAIIACGAMLTRHLMRDRSVFNHNFQTIEVETTENAILLNFYTLVKLQGICCISIVEKLPNGGYGKGFSMQVPFNAANSNQQGQANIRICLDGQCNEGQLDLLKELKKQTDEKISFRKLPVKANVEPGFPREVIIHKTYQMIDTQIRECVIQILVY